MSSLRLVILFLTSMAVSTVVAQKTKTVEGTYTYYVPANVTMEEAKRKALDQAKIQAIADEFGTIVQQSTSMRMKASNGKSSIDVSTIGGSEVKGEWIETKGEPEYQVGYVDGVLMVTCHVVGKAREIVTAQIDLQVHVLRNGTDDKFEDDDFRHGDDLYLSFRSPQAGYLAVYLMDASRQAFCLLPYQSQHTGIYPIEANRRYVFFHINSAPAEERSVVDEYTMTCEHSSEHNQLYVIFSPNQFVKAADDKTSERLPRQLGYEYFQRWLVKNRKHDHQMNVRMVPIDVMK